MVMENLDIEYTDIDYFEIVVTKTYSNKRIDRLLSDVIEGVSRSRLKKLIDSEFIRLNGGRTEPSHITKIGEIIQIRLPEPELVNLKPQKIPFDQIYEDDNLLVMNKRANLVMHPGNGNYENTILNGLLLSTLNPENYRAQVSYIDWTRILQALLLWQKIGLPLTL